MSNGIQRELKLCEQSIGVTQIFDNNRRSFLKILEKKTEKVQFFDGAKCFLWIGFWYTIIERSSLTNDESETSQTKQMKKFVLYEPSPDYHFELIINDALKENKTINQKLWLFVLKIALEYSQIAWSLGELYEAYHGITDK